MRELGKLLLVRRDSRGNLRGWHRNMSVGVFCAGLYRGGAGKWRVSGACGTGEVEGRVVDLLSCCTSRRITYGLANVGREIDDQFSVNNEVVVGFLEVQSQHLCKAHMRRASD